MPGLPGVPCISSRNTTSLHGRHSHLLFCPSQGFFLGEACLLRCLEALHCMPWSINPTKGRQLPPPWASGPCEHWERGAVTWTSCPAVSSREHKDRPVSSEGRLAQSDMVHPPCPEDDVQGGSPLGLEMKLAKSPEEGLEEPTRGPRSGPANEQSYK